MMSPIRRIPMSILLCRRSFPTAMVVVRNYVGGLQRVSAPLLSNKQSSDPDFEPKRPTSPPTYDEIKSKLEELIKNNKVVLFMKGSPTAPQCGFSRQVATVLAEEGLTDYIYVDVLKSETIRESIKKFSDWPTIPQLYIGGEFVGGCDIAKEMHKSGELKTMLESVQAI